MLSKILRLLLTLLLCVLLAYAPELFAAVSAPYAAKPPERTLLRIVLCTQDSESSASFYHALNQYRQSSPYTHVRVIRADETQLCMLSDPKPDVYVFSPDIQMQADEFLPLTFVPVEGDAAPHFLTVSLGAGESLCIGARLNADAQNTALDFISYLYALSTSALSAGK